MRFRAIALSFTLLCSLLVALPTAARADSILYTLTGTGAAAGNQLTYLSTAGFLSFGQYVPTTASHVYYSGDDAGRMSLFEFDPDGIDFFTDALFNGRPAGVRFDTANYSLNQYGLQTVLGQGEHDHSFTLDIESVTAPGGATTTVTPEPSSLMLLGTGLLGVVGAMRRRFTRTA